MLRWMVHSFITAFPGAGLLNRGDWTYRENRERAAKSAANMPAGWAGGAGNADLTKQLLALIREFKAAEACDLVVAQRSAGKAKAGAVWDAAHLSAAELMMRKPDVGYPLHSNTSANALHYGFRTSGDAKIRLLLLLQAIGWQCHARKRLTEQASADPKWAIKPMKIDEMEAVHVPANSVTAVQEIFSHLATQPDEASRRVLAYAKTTAQPRAFMATARRLLFAKLEVQETHDVKYPVSVFEDCSQVNDVWRPHLLASSVYWLPGNDRPDSLLMRQARDAVRRV